MMKRIVYLLMLIIAVFIVSGCATSKFTKTGEVYPPYEGPVKVLTERPEGQQYVEVGWVSSNGGDFHEWTDLIEAVQRKAATNGANAIILYKSDNTNSSMITYTPQLGLLGSSSSQKSLLAIAVRLLD